MTTTVDGDRRPSPRAPDTIPLPQALAHLPMSYRQIDYWTRVGYVRAVEPTPGSGTAREWSPTELAIANRIYLLVNAGLSLVVAARVARTAVEEGSLIVPLRGDVVIVLP